MLRAKGIVGLTHTSKMDEIVWNDFFNNPLKGQSVRAVICDYFGGMRSVGPTPKVLVYRCRTYSAP